MGIQTRRTTLHGDRGGEAEEEVRMSAHRTAGEAPSATVVPTASEVRLAATMKPQIADPAPRVAVLMIALSVGGLGITLGISYLLAPEPHAEWSGPVTCMVTSAYASWGAHEGCPTTPPGWTSVRRSLTMLALPDRQLNCTKCFFGVACGATASDYSDGASHPNLVDGRIEEVSPNATHPRCMRTGTTFSGYYLPSATGDEVQVLRSDSVHEARATHQLHRTLAPWALGTGSFALMASILYAVYVCAATWRRMKADEPQMTACWRGTPSWECRYDRVQDQGNGGVCEVCLVAPCGAVQFVGCGHRVVCTMCAGLVRFCPVCNERIDGLHFDSGYSQHSGQLQVKLGS